MVTEDQSITKAVDPPTPDDDPAGEVVVPLGRRAIIRAQLLSGTVLGLSAVFGVLGGDRDTGITNITI